jgi:hypothetical protein
LQVLAKRGGALYPFCIDIWLISGRMPPLSGQAHEGTSNFD